MYALYQNFLDTYKVDLQAAYKVAKQCLQRFPLETDQTRYLKKWVTAYDASETIARKWRVRQLIENDRFIEAFALGKEILSSEPEDVETLVNLINGGLGAMTYGNSAFSTDASNYAKKVIRLIDSGKATVENREKRLGWLNFALGIFFLTSAPAESAIYFSTAMRFEDFKNDAAVYALLADAMLGAQYMPLQEEYSHFTTQGQKTSAKAAAVRAKLDMVTDRMIDALARATALAGSNDRLAQEKTKWMKALTDLYKYRNSGYDTGLNQYIETILTKPFPLRVPPVRAVR
jgi:hypothetical protein